MRDYDFLIVGAGFAGSVLAERIANKLNKKVLVIDKRNHIGGNCYDYLSKNGILIQKYGPHIFHTNNKKVFDYLSKFTEWADYRHKVIAFHQGKYYPVPINLDTINRLYNINLNNEKELRNFLETKRIKIKRIENSRDVIVSKLGEEIYESFVKYYTKKQWGVYPEELDKSILGRLPTRYDRNPYYFDDKFQGMPRSGFGRMFKKMLDSRNITVMLDTDFFDIKDKIKYEKLIYTGALDRFFEYKHGKLKYRSNNFVFETLNQESFQPNSVVNYPDNDVGFLRVTEFKKFYGVNSAGTVTCKEIFGWDGEPSYPVIDERNQKLAKKYLSEAKKLKDTIFIGRLAQYKYLNMDEVAEEALSRF